MGGTMDGTDYWKVKNSWGPSWGMEGYILLEKGKDQAGECGIKMQPSYPVMSGAPPSPGPSPPPSPSSPPPPPSPPSPPSPSSGHYEKPPCQSDEIAAKISGAGSVCAASCDNAACPKDKPQGTLAVPSCTLQDQSGHKYCALTCIADMVCPTGAKCFKSGQSKLLGICVYPDDNAAKKEVSFTPPKDFAWPMESSAEIVV